MTPDWIAADWGSSNLRVWAMQGDQILAHSASDEGMGKLGASEFEAALLRLISGWLGAGVMPVIACGMVGSRQGWQEVPYRAVPCAPLQAGTLASVASIDARISLQIVAGLKQTTPADVMRGEETQIAGALAGLPGFDGVICLPGTHSKWVDIAGGQVAGFRSFMTGELFALLAEASVLRHGMGGAGWDDAAFEQAVAEAFTAPLAGTAALFTLRAEGLLAGLPAASARARLSGLLIGAELVSARDFWAERPVVLIGAKALSGLYAQALGLQGIDCQSFDATACTLAGLSAARLG
ncbi:2-dehydro-3-deoxygalactonokinase [Cypionkella sp.]|uniref:2-dehydro-3-deoxygalactonokinase n=1 Tax=Cypionkella sp. TaxID=2811411 RepID=UPI003752EF6D